MKKKYCCIIPILLLGMIFIYGVIRFYSRGTTRGITFTPKSFDAEGMTDFWEKAQEGGKIVTWSGDWNEMSDSTKAPHVVAKIAPTKSCIPIIIAQFFTQGTGNLLRPLDDTNMNLYKTYAENFAEEYKPDYIGFGIEINMLFEKNPMEYAQFVDFFNQVYDAFKTKSPNTIIFTVFQLEKMKGLNGGLFGGINDPTTTEWRLLDNFTKADLIAFTTYPCLIYTDPSDIPSDYYSEILMHTTKPIAFTEIGWHSAASPTGWESSQDEQSQFIERFFTLTTDVESVFSIWSFLYDRNTAVPFSTIGLLASDGTAKIAWETWKVQK